MVQTMENLVLCSDLLERPSQSADDVDTVFVDALEHFAQERLVVEGAFEVVLLCYLGLGWISRLT